jgi:hypothetical protein
MNLIFNINYAKNLLSYTLPARRPAVAQGGHLWGAATAVVRQPALRSSSGGGEGTELRRGE